jgi:hypothetical protein
MRHDEGMSENTTTTLAPIITFLRRGEELMWITRHDHEHLLRAVFPETRYPDHTLVHEAREMHVPRSADPDAYAAKMARLFDGWVAEYVAAGWTVDESVTDIEREPEPWDAPDPLTLPCTF